MSKYKMIIICILIISILFVFYIDANAQTEIQKTETHQVVAKVAVWKY